MEKPGERVNTSVLRIAYCQLESVGLARPLNANYANLAIWAARRLEIQDLVAPELREEFVGRLASIIALKPAVREALLDFQRSFARFPGGPADAPLAVRGRRGLVLQSP